MQQIKKKHKRYKNYKRPHKKYFTRKLYYRNSSIFGFRALFYILVGARGCGKTYSIQNYVLRQFIKFGRKFMWFRLTEPAVRNLLSNNGKDFWDSKLLLKWGIIETKTESGSMYIKFKEDQDFLEIGKIMAISTFYTQKGVALNKSGDIKTTKNTKVNDAQALKRLKNATKKFRILVCDEFNREKNEKKTFDISYAFVNQLETICRTDLDRRIILAGNTLDEASDILAGLFNFIPNQFGVFKLKHKKAIIHYIMDSDAYKEARKNSIAGILAPTESTFTNQVSSDFELVTNKKPSHIVRVIKFNNTCQFAVCDDGVITKWKLPINHKYPVIAMRPYIIGLPYYREMAQRIIDMAQQRMFMFDQLITLKLFYKEIKLLKDTR